MFGDKKATLARFKKNYLNLSDPVKKRLVLENDDMCWSVEDLLPTCQDLGIPLVLDWHHNNVIPGSLREGTQDVLKYIPAITALWRNRKITPKQHYSEPRNPEAMIRRDLRPHSKRVYSLPPCVPDMDLMIEAKDKEQAVFELRRKWNIEGGLPSEWMLTGEKMDEERDMPSEDGWKVFYGEGEEWRFKPPLKMPARIKKTLEKLEKQLAKVPEGDERKGEVAKLEEEKKVILLEWERERRIKWGLEMPETVEVTETEEIAVVDATPKQLSRGKSQKKRAIEEEGDGVAEWTPLKVAGKRRTSRRKREVVE